MSVLQVIIELTVESPLLGGGGRLLFGLLLDLIPVRESKDYCSMSCIITPCNSQLVFRVS